LLSELKISLASLLTLNVGQRLNSTKTVLEKKKGLAAAAVLVIAELSAIAGCAQSTSSYIDSAGNNKVLIIPFL
jgi:hypothetical protein